MHKQFWVIGAEYGDLQFKSPVDGSARVLGPYPNYQEANTVWRERSMESRHKALTRYTIVSEAAMAAGAPAAAA